jgi:hypothetical protein
MGVQQGTAVRNGRQSMLSSAVRPQFSSDAAYLRQQAHRCVQLARGCPHRPTSHELEALGMELMERAAEVDKLQAASEAPPKAHDDST